MSATPNPITEARDLMLAAGVRTDHAMMLLPIAHFVRLVEWSLLDRMPPNKVLKLAAREGLPPAKLPSKSALYQFLRDFSPFWRAASRRTAAQAANAVTEQAKQSPAEWLKAIADRLGQTVFEMLEAPSHSADDVKKLTTLVLKSAQMEHDESKIAIAERKLALMESKMESGRNVLADGSLTPEEKAKKMREILGMS